jgi:hypothetical protein
MGEPAVVVEGDVDEAVARERVVVLAAGSATFSGAVQTALLAAEEPPATTVGDVAQLLHVDVQQVSGRGVFVADDGVPRRSSRDGQLIRQRRSTGPPVDAATPLPAAGRTGPQRLRSCSDTIRFVLAWSV